ncbi:glycoside hydrolase family 3 N-terminal domain-containing protein [Corynebacterium sp. sy039]|uniref:glycoside hydrolase family 3 N-terminal domain-containing protein n=1 Tax=Corynebacterium sp. sy039 TaxID=2599641 RepID=UPI0011B409AD|nr:glycoside hydrolase family 3 N-terminal domain-containing protein [Corynebacterium sp. sy039]QDZ41963.1 glycoside hydrolase family 3 protein [Corynebacterium sp. sy039]
MTHTVLPAQLGSRHSALRSTLLSVTVVLCAPFLLSSCSSDSAESPRHTSTSTSSVAPAYSLPSEAKPVDETPAQLRQRVARLMMVGVRGFDDALWALEQGVGGIFISSNTDPTLLTQPGRDIAALREKIHRPFDVSIDFEGGRVLRHGQILGYYQAPQVMAETMSPEQVRGLAYDMGKSLASHGITVNFAPVVDLDGAGLDIIGDRAFSDDDPAVAVKYATAFATGMKDAGVMPVFKHFPGHGRASGDTHTGAVQSPPLVQLEELDLLPYGKVLADSDCGVMIGHMIVPELSDNAPASQSAAVYELLRSGRYPGGVPFDGIIYTDDLSGMKAITNYYPIEQAVLGALQAGANQALWISTQGLDSAIEQVAAAIESQRYPRTMFEKQFAQVERHLAKNS